ncbi:MAG: DUF2829 domain-containing protein [Bacteroides sp.]
MKQYIGTKVINAEPCMRADEEGYKVIYSDGYESWSPKCVFDAAYRPMSGMTFGQAIEAAKVGHKIKRSGWNGKNQYVELASCISYKDPNGTIVNAQHDAIGNRAFAFCGTSGVQLGWSASQADMLAEDWEIAQ